VLVGASAAERIAAVRQQRLLVDMADYGDDPSSAAVQSLVKKIDAFLHSPLNPH
jgi:hypothetical protein